MGQITGAEEAGRGARRKRTEHLAEHLARARSQSMNGNGSHKCKRGDFSLNDGGFSGVKVDWRGRGGTAAFNYPCLHSPAIIADDE